jgi:hypothetical protein
MMAIRINIYIHLYSYINSKGWRESPLFISLRGVVLFNHWLDMLDIYEDAKVKARILRPTEGDFSNLNYYVINVKEKLPEGMLIIYNHSEAYGNLYIFSYSIKKSFKRFKEMFRKMLSNERFSI